MLTISETRKLLKDMYKVKIIMNSIILNGRIEDVDAKDLTGVYACSDAINNEISRLRDQLVNLTKKPI